MLYGPLVFLHEPIGGLLWGDAWQVRRRYVLDYVDLDGPILDVGCGAGQLLAYIRSQGLHGIGVEPSKAMQQRARRSGLDVRDGTVSSLPVADNSIGAIVATYPGGWILDSMSHFEFERALVTGARWAALLGGSYETGSWHRLRGLLLGLFYGDQGPRTSTFTEETGKLQIIARRDAWGVAYILVGCTGS